MDPPFSPTLTLAATLEYSSSNVIASSSASRAAFSAASRLRLASDIPDEAISAFEGSTLRDLCTIVEVLSSSSSSSSSSALRLAEMLEEEEVDAVVASAAGMGLDRFFLNSGAVEVDAGVTDDEDGDDMPLRNEIRVW